MTTQAQTAATLGVEETALQPANIVVNGVIVGTMDTRMIESVKRFVIKKTRQQVRLDNLKKKKAEEEARNQELLKDLKTPFKLFSAEPTYMYDVTKSGISSKYQDDLIEPMTGRIVNFIKVKSDELKIKTSTYNWFECSCNDGGNLELGTCVYDNFKDFIRDLKAHETVLKQFNMIPSSLVDMDGEGGCHLNFDTTLIRRMNESIYKLFCQNLITFFRNVPSMVWLFLSDNDNQSSTFCTSSNNPENFGKGDFISFQERTYYPHSDEITGIKDKQTHFESNDRGKQLDGWYVELRMFKMSRSIEEFTLYYDYCIAILDFVWNHTKQNKTLGVKKGVVLKSYTHEKAVKEIKEICTLINFDYKRIEKNGSLSILKQRFKNGKDYLV